MVKEKTRSAVTMAVKKPKHRSPNYPSINLEEALDRTTALYNSARLHAVPVSVAHETWGFKAFSASGDQSVAALKAFGLLDAEGSGNKRQVRVSDVARRIILESPDRSDLIKQAALSPKIHSELWAKYGEGGLPSDEILRSYLVFDLKFNEASVNAFIDEFRYTLHFAGVVKGATIRDETGYDPAKSPNIIGTARMPSIFGTEQPPPTSGYKDFPLHFPNNREGVLRVPLVATEEDYNLLKEQIDHSMRILKAISRFEKIAENKTSET